MRHPNRIRSLIGLARSAKLNGDKIIAKENYEKLLSLLKNANSTVPELEEAKIFLDQF